MTIKLSQFNIKSSDLVANDYQYQEYLSPELEVRVFDENSYNGPQTEDFIRRAESLHQAATRLNIPSDAEIQRQLDENLRNTIAALKMQANIEPDKLDDEGYFSKKYNLALNLLRNFNASNLSLLNRDAAALEKAEAEVVAATKRPQLVHLYETGKYTRVSTSTPIGDHTNPSTVRDKPELSNFVRVTSGYVDKEGQFVEEFMAYRHSSYPPIAEPDKLKRRNGAVASVEQMLLTLVQNLDISNLKQPIEIKLSTMMLLTPLLGDGLLLGAASEYRQVKETMLALNMLNGQEIGLNIQGQTVNIKPILTQMNMPSNDVMKYQLKKLGGKFNDNINHKGFYEYAQNFFEYINNAGDKAPADIQHIVALYQKDEALIRLNGELKALQDKYRLTALYQQLRALQTPETYTEYKNVLKQIGRVEAEFNIIYKAIIDQQKAIWKANAGMMKISAASEKAFPAAQLFLDSAEIFYTKAHKKIKYGHQFQTRYVLANQFMGQAVDFFCKSGEDRTGRLNNHIEEFLAYRQQHGIFPHFGDKAAGVALKSIAESVHQGSVSQKITDQNAPGARGLQQTEDFGSNEHLVFDRQMGILAREVYAKPQHCDSIDALIQEFNVSLEAQQKIKQEKEKIFKSFTAEMVDSAPVVTETAKLTGESLIYNIHEAIKKLANQSEPKGSFSVETSKDTDSVIVKKNQASLMTVTPKEICASSDRHEINDYIFMLKTALALYKKPLQIYVSPLEADKLEVAARKAGLAKADFSYTTDYQAYISTISKSNLEAPHSGQHQLGGTSSQCVPGGMPSSG